MSALSLLALAGALATHNFQARVAGEAIAIVSVACEACAWEVDGREAVYLSITLDDREPLRLPVVRSGRADYHVLLGSVEPGAHQVIVDEDAALTSRDLRGKRAASIEGIRTEQTTERGVSLAPIVYARPDTVGRFTDAPVFMWYELEPTDRGTRYRYSVIFTNEDGGTPTDRLMATWGRTTDIEYLYSVEVDSRGQILAEDMQGAKHEVLAFKGRREGRHPLLWVSTSNNMVLDHGSTDIRYAPAPVAFPLNDVSREAVMDEHPWLYELMSKELAREGKIAADAPPGTSVIPDPRTFVYLEACGHVGDNALAFAVRVNDQWIPSDRGIAEYRIVRDGCVRAAIPLPAGRRLSDVRAFRAQAYERADRKAATPIELTSVNALFALDDRYVPGRSVLTWNGSVNLHAGGPALELPIP